MTKFDMHIHSDTSTPNPDALLQAMDNAGIYGGCVFSTPPAQMKMPESEADFDSRLNRVLAWAQKYPDRIFPVIWIHPFEDDIFTKIKRAVDKGISAFKIICTDFYIYDDIPMQVVRYIASLNKPIIFHTGILWDGNVSSNYNRPLNWEALLDVEGLKFSLGHCSWPWIDECIALYGKFLNSGRGAEMFFDVTPGTPKIYREELLAKLYTIGYNVGDNVMFGSDCSAQCYRNEWVSDWLKTDNDILDKLGVSLQNRQKMYRDNMMRFLGLTDTNVQKEAPVPDDSHVWSAKNPEVNEIIKKWYKILEFPKEFDDEFYAALETVNISDAVTIDNYNMKSQDGIRNLLSFLFMCEAVEKKYEERGLPHDVLVDTLSDIVVWTKAWTSAKGSLYLREIGWIASDMRLEIFKIGRLQYCMSNAKADVEKYGIKKGDNVIDIHIPAGESLTPEACRESLSKAKEFFAKYFPEFSYKCFTCDSWLLDDKLEQYLPQTSNIIQFANMFDKIHKTESEAILRFVFRRDTTMVNLKYAVAPTALAQKIKTALLNGEKFHEAYGILKG